LSSSTSPGQGSQRRWRYSRASSSTRATDCRAGGASKQREIRKVASSQRGATRALRRAGAAAYADEILICEGDLPGQTREQLRSLHFHEDRDSLPS